MILSKLRRNSLFALLAAWQMLHTKPMNEFFKIPRTIMTTAYPVTSKFAFA